MLVIMVQTSRAGSRCTIVMSQEVHVTQEVLQQYLDMNGTMTNMVSLMETYMHARTCTHLLTLMLARTGLKTQIIPKF